MWLLDTGHHAKQLLHINPTTWSKYTHTPSSSLLSSLHLNPSHFHFYELSAYSYFSAKSFAARPLSWPTANDLMSSVQGQSKSHFPVYHKQMNSVGFHYACGGQLSGNERSAGGMGVSLFSALQMTMRKHEHGFRSHQPDVRLSLFIITIMKISGNEKKKTIRSLQNNRKWT